MLPTALLYLSRLLLLTANILYSLKSDIHLDIVLAQGHRGYWSVGTTKIKASVNTKLGISQSQDPQLTIPAFLASRSLFHLAILFSKSQPTLKSQQNPHFSSFSLKNCIKRMSFRSNHTSKQYIFSSWYYLFHHLNRPISNLIKKI